MCTQKPPHDYSEALYNRYRDIFCYYINESVRILTACAAQVQLSAHSCFQAGFFSTSTDVFVHAPGHLQRTPAMCLAHEILPAHQVLPSLHDQRDETLLKELHRRWGNHNIMTRWLSRFFNYLDRCAHSGCSAKPLHIPLRTWPPSITNSLSSACKPCTP